ncbi:MAG: hypothetical protein R6U27_12010 [Desulfobacterales bacterium]
MRNPWQAHELFAEKIQQHSQQNAGKEQQENVDHTADEQRQQGDGQDGNGLYEHSS